VLDGSVGKADTIIKKTHQAAHGATIASANHARVLTKERKLGVRHTVGDYNSFCEKPVGFGLGTCDVHRIA
jgi:hypothetical protein